MEITNYRLPFVRHWWKCLYHRFLASCKTRTRQKIRRKMRIIAREIWLELL